MVSMLVGLAVLVAIAFGLGMDWGRVTAPNRCAGGEPCRIGRRQAGRRVRGADALRRLHAHRDEKQRPASVLGIGLHGLH